MFDSVEHMPYILAMKTPRPLTQPLVRREANIGIRTTPEIKAGAESAAIAEGRSTSQWIERLILAALKKAQSPRKFPSLQGVATNPKGMERSMATTFRLPARLTQGNNLHNEAELEIRENQGVYVYVCRVDTGEEVELIEEGNGEPGAVERLIKHVRSNRRSYVEGRITDALSDDWHRERLGLPLLP